MRAATVEGFDGTRAYLDLLKLCLNGLTPPNGAVLVDAYGDKSELVPVSPEIIGRKLGNRRAWRASGFTMMGLDRTENLQACVEDVLANEIPGDLIETGVWRGGATIFMRALLKLHGVTDRKVVVADSFEGVPPPDDEAFPQDTGSRLHEHGHLVVSAELVRDNFARFGLLDDQVEFLEGRFRDTLPTLSDRTWSVVRLDGDLYESTMNGLEELYPNLSPGGYLIVDDYGAIRKCRAAVHDYRDAHGIDEEIHKVDWTCVFWQKQG
jgi:hypothetical protein